MDFANKRHALELSLTDWQQWRFEKGLPKFNGKQIFQWIFQKENLDPTTFTNLSSDARKDLKEEFEWNLFEIDSRLISQDGTEKFILKTTDNLLFEMVVMPYESRTTLCVSSQVGCKLGCTFCQTGKMGLQRNLSSAEILAQIFLANRALQGKKVTNVVFMGMGEPLDNYDAVVKACSQMIDKEGLALSKSRVTISTAGLVPKINQLGRDLPVRLAISLHSADDEKRSAMMPINRTYNLEDLKRALLSYPAPKQFGITLEYVMIDGANDSIQDAKKLVKFIHGLKVKVNLIPLNPFPGQELRASQEERLKEFQEHLSTRSIPAPIRYSRGQDISGACGQLATKRESELQMDPRDLRRQRKRPERRISAWHT